MNINIPFYHNTPDNTHCFQACIKMIAKHFWPEENYLWKELDGYTAKVRGLWTWPMAGALWLQNKDIGVVDIEIFDYKKFVEEKDDYLISFYGQEAGREQIKHSNIDQEMDYARKFQEKVRIQKRIPDKNDFIKLLKQHYLVICCVNQQALNGKNGYAGHFVVVKGYDRNGLFLHDPGLPAYENRKVSFELFEKAWAYPDKKVKNILAFKIKRDEKC